MMTWRASLSVHCAAGLSTHGCPAAQSAAPKSTAASGMAAKVVVSRIGVRFEFCRPAGLESTTERLFNAAMTQ